VIPGREALRHGLQTLRALGLRGTELAQMSPLSVATLKRYVQGIDPTVALVTGALDKLTVEHKTALTAFWVQSIAGGRPVPPPVPARAFLDFFCSVCLHRLALDDTAVETPDSRPVPGVIALHEGERPCRDLTEAVVRGLRVCEAGARLCASSAARFAALTLALRVQPWEAYRFITSEISPHRWWVRRCLACDTLTATEATAHRFCLVCRPRIP